MSVNSDIDPLVLHCTVLLLTVRSPPKCKCACLTLSSYLGPKQEEQDYLLLTSYFWQKWMTDWEMIMRDSVKILFVSFKVVGFFFSILKADRVILEKELNKSLAVLYITTHFRLFSFLLPFEEKNISLGM